jgi:undecaprenyl diphosphate synthase
MNPIKHVAIIMAGNGRWGIKKKKNRNFGHKKGLVVIENIINHTAKKKIPYLTLYTFSTENWKRPKIEINFLFRLLLEYLNKNLSNIIKKGIKIKILGDLNKFPNNLKKILKEVELKTKKNKLINVNLALNYGSKKEIIYSFKNVIKKKQKINIKNIEENLYTSGMPNPDFIIRTGGKIRLSNFLLWQSAYSEIFFLNKLWPTFSTNDFDKIVNKFKKIKRNYGSI